MANFLGTLIGLFGKKEPSNASMPEVQIEAKTPANPLPELLPEFQPMQKDPVRISATVWLDKIAKMTVMQRNAEIKTQCVTANVPQWMEFVHMESTEIIDGKQVKLTFQCMPDYLCIGTSEDFISVPMSYDLSVAVAKHLNCEIPTRKIVNLIYKQAEIKLEPRPLPPITGQMESTAYMIKQNALIESQKSGFNRMIAINGRLIAGHKKDIVISALMAQKPRNEAIYGWHQKNGVPIQNLSLAHTKDYLDYSHGLRLINKQVIIKDERTGTTYPSTIKAVLADPKLCVLLSDEGPVNI